MSVNTVATFVAALGCGLIAGVFFTFSSFVMKALGRLPAPEAVAAMQSINIGAVQSWFLPAFLGTAALCLFVVVSSLGRWDEPSSMLATAGAATYIAGSLLLTLFVNVPMNNTLAGIAPGDPDLAVRWAHYLSDWTFWNHVRTVLSLAASGLLIAALHAN